MVAHLLSSSLRAWSMCTAAACQSHTPRTIQTRFRESLSSVRQEGSGTPKAAVLTPHLEVLVVDGEDAPVEGRLHHVLLQVLHVAWTTRRHTPCQGIHVSLLRTRFHVVLGTSITPPSMPVHRPSFQQACAARLMAFFTIDDAAGPDNTASSPSTLSGRTGGAASTRVMPRHCWLTVALLLSQPLPRRLAQPQDLTSNVNKKLSTSL